MPQPIATSCGHWVNAVHRAAKIPRPIFDLEFSGDFRSRFMDIFIAEPPFEHGFSAFFQLSSTIREFLKSCLKNATCAIRGHSFFSSAALLDGSRDFREGLHVALRPQQAFRCARTKLRGITSSFGESA